jgi:GxxExxY protein
MVSDQNILDAAGGVFQRLGQGGHPEHYRSALARVLQAHGLQSRTRVVTRVGNYDDVEILDVVDLDDALLIEGGIVVQIRSSASGASPSPSRLAEYVQKTGAGRGLLLDFSGGQVTAVPFLSPRGETAPEPPRGLSSNLGDSSRR